MSNTSRRLCALALLLAAVGLVTVGCRGSVSGQNTPEVIVVPVASTPAPTTTPEPTPAPEPETDAAE